MAEGGRDDGSSIVIVLLLLLVLAAVAYNVVMAAKVASALQAVDRELEGGKEIVDRVKGFLFGPRA